VRKLYIIIIMIAIFLLLSKNLYQSLYKAVLCGRIWQILLLFLFFIKNLFIIYKKGDSKFESPLFLFNNYFSNLLFKISASFSYPFLPNRANILALYDSTPGWLNGFTPSRYPLIPHAFSKK